MSQQVFFDVLFIILISVILIINVVNAEDPVLVVCTLQMYWARPVLFLKQVLAAQQMLGVNFQATW